MSEPITLTERERAVFESLAAHCDRGLWSEMASELREWLAATPAESAAQVGVESGPGQPIDVEVTLEECPPGLFFFGDDNYLGFKSEYSTTQAKNGVVQCDAYVVSSGEYFWGGASSSAERAALKVRPVDAVAAIRALANKPAPDALLPGLEHAMKAWESDDIGGPDVESFAAWLEHEIAARKEG